MPVQAHISDFNNPHGVDKHQVALGELENYPVAAEQEAKDGVATNRYMTPLRARQNIDQYLMDNGLLANPDGWNVTSVNFGDRDWGKVIYAQNKYVALDTGTYGGTTSGRIMTSANGTDWTLQTTPALANQATRNWRSIAYGNGVFVAVAETGTDAIMTSPDGIAWTMRTAPGAGWKDIAFGNGYFIAVGIGTGSGPYSNTVMRSTDGVNWSFLAPPTANQFLSVAFGGGKFVLGSLTTNAGQIVVTANDGNTFTSHSLPGSSGTWGNISGLAFNDGIWIAAQQIGTRVYRSTDAQNWTEVPLTFTSSAVTVAVGFFMVIGTASGTSAFSLDGTEWTNINTPPHIWKGLTFGNGKFLATATADQLATVMTLTPNFGVLPGSKNTPSVWYSGGTVESFHRITHGNGLFVGIAPGKVLYSATGNSWGSTLITNMEPGSIAFGNGAFLIGRSTDTTDTVTLRRSTDGINWVNQAFPISALIPRIRYVNGTFFACCRTNSSNPVNLLYASADGINWSQRTLPGTIGGSSMLEVLYGNGVYVILMSADSGGGIYSIHSSDGITWTKGNELLSTAWPIWSSTVGTYLDGNFYVVMEKDSNVYMLKSSNGQSWTPTVIDNGVTGGVWSVHSSGTRLIAVSKTRFISSYDGVTWTNGDTVSDSNWIDLVYGDNKFLSVGGVGPNGTTSAMLMNPMGDSTAGFFGEVPSTNLIRDDELAAMIGLSATFYEPGGHAWLKFILDGQILFVYKQPHIREVSWKDIYDVGAVHGDGTTGETLTTPVIQDTEVTIGGIRYKVRLLRGATENPTSSPYATDGSEWNRLIFNVLTGTQAGQEGVNWANYSTSDLRLLSNLSWVQERTPSANLLRDGGNTGGAAASTTREDYIWWRPVLEPILD